MSTDKTDKTIRVQLPDVLVEWIDDYVGKHGLESRSDGIAYAVAEFRALIDTMMFLTEQRTAETAQEERAALDRHLAREERFAGLRQELRRD